MRVKFIRRTYTAELGFLNAGEIMDIDDKTGSRWINKRIAVEIDVPVKKSKVLAKAPAEAPEKVTEEETSVDGLDEMTYSQLLMLAKNNGIEFKKRPKKAELIELLRGV